MYRQLHGLFFLALASILVLFTPLPAPAEWYTCEDPAAVAADAERQEAARQKTNRIMLPIVGGMAALGMLKLGYDLVNSQRTRRKPDPDRPWEYYS